MAKLAVRPSAAPVAAPRPAGRGPTISVPAGGPAAPRRAADALAPGAAARDVRGGAEALAALLERAAAGAVLQGPLPEYSIELWHGFNLPLLMSVVALADGALVYFARRYHFDLIAALLIEPDRRAHQRRQVAQRDRRRRDRIVPERVLTAV